MKDAPPPADTPEELMTALALFCFTLLAIALGCVALTFSCLRETHEFWLNSGGYPILLRDMVMIGYYPVLLLNFCLLVGLTVVPCAKLKMPRSFLVIEFCLLGLAWFLLAISIAVSAKNNIINYWNDRPIHYKAPSSIQ